MPEIQSVPTSTKSATFLRRHRLVCSLLLFVSGLAFAYIVVAICSLMPALAACLPHSGQTTSDFIVVLGAAVWPDEQPSPALRERTALGIRLYQEGKAPYLIFTGGLGWLPPAEAEVMRRQALAAGVPAEAIVVEDQAHSTQESAVLVARIAQEHDWHTATVVSDPFHLYRSALLFQDAGLTVSVAGTDDYYFSPSNKAYLILREAAAIAMYTVQKPLRLVLGTSAAQSWLSDEKTRTVEADPIPVPGAPSLTWLRQAYSDSVDNPLDPSNDECLSCDEPPSDSDTAEVSTVPVPILDERPSAALIAVLEGDIEGRPEIYGIAVKNLTSGEYAVINGDLQMDAASLYKLTVLYEAALEIQAEELSLDEDLIVSEDAALKYEDGDPTLAISDTVTVAEALYRMVTISDNTCAHVLLERVPAWRINSTMESLGLNQTQILDGVRTSPLDMLRLLEKIAVDAASNDAASSLALQLLLDQMINDRIPALLPDGTPVAHKTGNLDGIRHDAGIVYAPRGPYVIVIMTQGEYDDEEVSNVMARMSRDVFDYFES